jgi:protein TonB
LPDNFSEFDAEFTEVVNPPTPAKVEVPERVPLLPRGKSRSSSVSRTPAKFVPDIEERAPMPSPKRLQPVRASKDTVEDESEGKSKSKNKIAIAGVAAILIVGAGIGLKLFRPAPQAVATNQAPASAATSAATALVPESAEPQTKPSAAPATSQAAQATPAAAPEERRPVGTEMMNQQLNAPSRISPSVKNPQRDAPPPSGFAASGMEGMSGNPQVGNVFGKHAGPVVQRAPEAPHKITVSAGVIQGMLVQKPAPVYPQLAKQAHISGTVVLQITIGKNGATEDVRAVSGPTVLRQAAVDAVRNWRYKPYMINNEATEVEGQASVRFQTSQ